MALTKDWTLNVHGKEVVFEGAYIQVVRTSGTKDSQTAAVSVFSDNTKAREIDTQRHSFAPNLRNGNFIAQAYAHLKTLPEYDGAEDC